MSEAHPVEIKVGEIAERIVSLKTVAERFTPDPGFLIPGLLPTDARYVFITGPSKHQKTWVTHEIVTALGDGTPFLGLYPLSHQRPTEQVDDLGREVFETVEGLGKAQKTLYVQQENSEYSMEIRHRAILEARHGPAHIGYDYDESGARIGDFKRAFLGGNDHIDLLPRMALDLTNLEHAEAVARVCKSRGYENLVLDSTYQLATGNLNETEYANRLVDSVKKIYEFSGTRIFLIHHSSTKGEAGAKKLRESMGSTYFTSAWYDLEIRVWRDPDGVVTLRPIWRDGDLEDRTIRMLEPGIWEEVTELTMAIERQSEVTALREFLESLGYTEDDVKITEDNRTRLPSGLNQETVAKQLGWAKEKVGPAIRQLVMIRDADQGE